MIYNNLSIIVAIGKNNEIGRNNELLVHLPNDMKRFKELTLNTTVVMGENTYRSLQVQPLPKRRNVVLTFDKSLQLPAECELAYSVEEALDLVKNDSKVFVMGGASIYRQFLPLVSKLYLTKINANFAGSDAFFPEIDYSQWNLIEQMENTSDEKHLFDYTYCTYNRIIK
ncbi:MAG: dihydrofolate reductase [Bacteroidales bacterium]|jgi:dihydrofolate reductase|nr:dihydrofolate reductase [Bacteroidales bacterium]